MVKHYPKEVPKSKISKKKSYFGIIKRHKIIGFILLLVVLIFGYKYGSIYLEKRDLEHKRVKLEQLADDIAAKYPPSERKTEQYCSKGSGQKYEKLPTNCSIGQYIYYNGIDSGKADEIKNKTSNLLGLSIVEGSYPKTEVKHFVYNNNQNKWNFYYSEILGIKSCSIFYSYEEYQKKQLEVSLICIKNYAKKEYFQLKY